MASFALSSNILISFVAFLFLSPHCNSEDNTNHDNSEIMKTLKELTMVTDTIESYLTDSQKELLVKVDIIKNEMEAKFQSMRQDLELKFNSRIDQLESKLSRTCIKKESPSALTTDQVNSEVESSQTEVELTHHGVDTNSACSGLTSEMIDSLSRVTKMLIDLEEERHLYSTAFSKISSIELAVNATRDELIEHRNNWTDAQSQRLKCKEGWQFFDDSCYFFSFSEGNWSHGRQQCLQMGSDYVKVTNNNEWNFIASHITSNSWVGLSDINDEGTFKWIVDGTIETDMHEGWWHKGQPDNHKGNEDCVHYRFFWQKNLWNDANCRLRMRYICEMSPTEIFL